MTLNLTSDLVSRNWCISPILFEIGIPNLVCKCILGCGSVTNHFWVTVTLTSDLYPTKKETHHLKLFNSQENHKRYANLVYISAKVCQLLLRHTPFAIRRRNCVKENWLRTKWGSNCKVTVNKYFYNALLLDKFKQLDSSQ